MTDFAVCCSKKALSTLTILPGRVFWGLGFGFSSVYGLWPGSCSFSYASGSLTDASDVIVMTALCQFWQLELRCANSGNQSCQA